MLAIRRKYRNDFIYFVNSEMAMCHVVTALLLPFSSLIIS